MLFRSALEGNARFGEEACYALLLLLLALLAPGGVDGSPVADQGATLSKARSANFADMWPFACVGAPVGGQGAAMRKACSTARIIAGVRSFSCMCALVLVQVAVLRETHSAVFTDTRPLSCMNLAHVYDQAAAMREAFPTARVAQT